MPSEAVSAGEMVSQWTKKKELTNKEQMKAVTMLIGQLQNGHLPYGSITIIAKNFSIAHMTLL